MHRCRLRWLPDRPQWYLDPTYLMSLNPSNPLLLSGNVIANRGFIRHFGFQNAAGVYTLNAQYTALWGAMQSLGQLIGMLFLTPVSDRIGRKMTLYVSWIILAGVCTMFPSQNPKLR
jgi:MFS family permease